VITDFQAGVGGDRIMIGGSVANPFETGQLIVKKSDSDTIIQFKDASGVKRSVLRLKNVDPTLLTPYNFGGLSFPFSLAVTINDTDQGNTLAGSRDNDRIFGNGGSDIISGYAGNDSLAGGADADTIRGDEGDDWLAGQEGHDNLSGGAGNDTLSGGSGDDVIYGGELTNRGSGNDVFDGGTGDDTLVGGVGDDLYHFARGDGRDLVADSGGQDRIRFAAGITSDDVTVVQVGRSLEFRIAGDTSRILLNAVIDHPHGEIERIEFHDGTVWTWQKVLTRGSIGRSGDQTLEVVLPEGVLSRNLLVNGSFEFYGQAWTAGYGIQAWDIPGWTQRNHHYYELVDSGHGGVFATEGGRWLDLDGSNHNMDLSQSVAGLTAGQQLLLQFDYASRASLGSGTFEVLWNDQVLGTLGDNGLAMETQSYLITASAGSNSVRFRALGTVDAVGASLDNVRLRAIAAGDYAPVTLSGGGGNDRLTGSHRDDILIGGTGDDRLIGGLGDDRYVFGRGDGQDVIDDDQGFNRLALGAGITTDQVRLVRSASSIALEIIGTGDRIELGSSASPTMGIREVLFEDGTVWTVETLIARALAATGGDDLIYGTDVADLIAGGAGDDALFGRGGDDRLAGNLGVDRLEGGAGSDVYSFARGDGQDVIRDSEGTADRIEFAAGILPTDILVTQSRDGTKLVLKIKGSDERITIENAVTTGIIETVRFADGTRRRSRHHSRR
jgi:Ca2+-binding RTX toxin-like protein